LRDEWNVRVLVSRYLLDIVEESWFLAEGADVKIGIFSRICNTRVDAAVIYRWLEIREVEE
jgi:hypothetical protein